MSFWSEFGEGFRDGIDLMTSLPGKVWNKVTGKTELLEKEQAFNSAEAQKQRDWQEYMSNSAHQREMADMQEAGLNPILSSGGTGASVNSGATASSSGGAPAGNFFTGIAAVLSSAASLTNNKNLDRETTHQIYNSAGNLIKTVEIYARDL